MSRIGRMPIPLPPGVKVSIENNKVTVAGPKGTLTRTFNPDMSIALKDNILSVSRPSDSNKHRALHGLTRTLLANMVKGVTTGFEKGLEIVGVGYRAEKSGDKVLIRIGYTHPVEITPAAGTVLATEGATKIKVSGADKEAVGQMAAKIRKVRLPDMYKGKGLRYAGEAIHTKPGKAGKVVGKK